MFELLATLTLTRISSSLAKYSNASLGVFELLATLALTHLFSSLAKTSNNSLGVFELLATLALTHLFSSLKSLFITLPSAKSAKSGLSATDSIILICKSYSSTNDVIR